MLNWKTEYESIEKKKQKKNYKYVDNVLHHYTGFLREPPTGLMLLAAAAENRGYSVDIIDCSILGNPFQFIRENASNYRLFGITSLTNTYYGAMQLAKTARRFNPNAFIVMGGPHVSFEYKSVLLSNPYIDIAFIGESDLTFPQILDIVLIEPEIELSYKNIRIKKNKKYWNYPGKIPKTLLNLKTLPKGIAFLRKSIVDPFISSLNNSIIDKDFVFIDESTMLDSGEREKRLSNESEIIFTDFPDPVNLSEVPLPSRHLINMNYNVADIIVNRGCPNRCSFCSRTQLFPKYRIRSVSDIMKEVKQVLSYSNYRSINFYDNININHKYFGEFLDELIKLKLKIPWGAELRVDTITEEEAKKMKESNCKVVATGIESADLEVLKKNLKFQDPKLVAHGIKILKKYNIAVQAYIIIGLPGDNEEKFQYTLDYIESLPLRKDIDKLETFVCTPFPGSKLQISPELYDIKITDPNYNHFNTHDIVMETSTLSSKKMKLLLKKAKKLRRKMGLL